MEGDAKLRARGHCRCPGENGSCRTPPARGHGRGMLSPAGNSGTSLRVPQMACCFLLRGCAPAVKRVDLKAARRAAWARLARGNRSGGAPLCGEGAGWRGSPNGAARDLLKYNAIMIPPLRAAWAHDATQIPPAMQQSAPRPHLRWHGASDLKTVSKDIPASALRATASDN